MGTEFIENSLSSTKKNDKNLTKNRRNPRQDKGTYPTRGTFVQGVQGSFAFCVFKEDPRVCSRVHVNLSVN